MLRAKIDASGDFVENSYNSPDSVNSIKWDTLEDETYQNVYNYYKGLIAFRKAHAALRLTNANDVVRPSAEECAQNGRARSTKMRWAVRAE